MDNPITTVKSALSLNKIIAGAFVLLVILVAADLAGLTPWVLYPVSSAKNWFAKRKAATA